eukprot:331523_1
MNINLKQDLIEISHLSKEENTNGKKLVLALFNHILNNPSSNKHYKWSVQLTKIQEKLANSLPFLNLLYHCGFYKSRDSQRLWFDQAKLKQLEIVRELLLNQDSCIELLELVEQGFTINEAKAAINMSTSIHQTNNTMPDEETKMNDKQNVLLQMGFDEQSSKDALCICDNSINEALNYLLSQKSLHQKSICIANESNNIKKLEEIVSEFIDSKPSSINSDYLLTGVECYNPYIIRILHQYDEICRLDQCQSLRRISGVLQRYHSYIEQQQNEGKSSDQSEAEIDLAIQQLVNSGITLKEAKLAVGLSVDHITFENIYLSHKYKYTNVNLLNDFNHSLFVHSGSKAFDDIYNILFSESESQCKIKNCLLFRRNQRNRTIDNRKLYFNHNDQRSIIQQQLIDRIHSYYYHSYDCGYRISKQEKERINNQESKINHENNSYDTFDRNIYAINNLIKLKRSSLDKITEFTRLNWKNNKFSMQIDEKQQENDYSFGKRYFYWKCYQDQYSSLHHDPAHQFEGMSVGSKPPANPGYVLRDWYIDPKYKNFKQELLTNSICTLPLSAWHNLMMKANDHIQTDITRHEMCCVRKESALYYEMHYAQPMSIHHLIAMMVYCNFDILQQKFTETFRYQSKNESDTELKERHRNYHHLGRLLREFAECYGVCTVGLLKNINLYHGLNGHFSFSSLIAYIAGPLSTTTEYSVAVSFSNQNCQGMILSINMNKMDWKIKYNEGPEAFSRISCIDCRLLSDYVSEQEIFFIGGLNKFTFNTVIEASTGTNYSKYVNGLNQMTYCMSNGDGIAKYCVDPTVLYEPNVAKSKEERQMVFRLLSHELYRHFPNHPYSHEFKGCPQYIKKLLCTHCQNIRSIQFFNGKYNLKESKLHEMLFKYDNEWIRLDLIATLFPNITNIMYDAELKDIQFLRQSAIYNSILSFISNHKYTKLLQITIVIDRKFCKEIQTVIDFYRVYLNKYKWDICLHIVENELEGTEYEKMYSSVDEMKHVLSNKQKTRILIFHKSLRWGKTKH